MAFGSIADSRQQCTPPARATLPSIIHNPSRTHTRAHAQVVGKPGRERWHRQLRSRYVRLLLFAGGLGWVGQGRGRGGKLMTAPFPCRSLLRDDIRAPCLLWLVEQPWSIGRWSEASIFGGRTIESGMDLTLGFSMRGSLVRGVMLSHPNTTKTLTVLLSPFPSHENRRRPSSRSTAGCSW